jgi:hypothetical protein
MLSTAELHTLEILNDRDRFEPVCRTHLEKLSRLDLIEPCPEGVCVSDRGREILESR